MLMQDGIMQISQMNSLSEYQMLEILISSLAKVPRSHPTTPLPPINFCNQKLSCG